MPRSEPSEASATAFVLASSLFRSLTNWVVSRTSVSRLSFCASAAFDSASALAKSARLRLQPATDTAIRTRSAVDLIRSLLRVDGIAQRRAHPDGQARATPRAGGVLWFPWP